MFSYAEEPLNALIDPTVSKITLCWGSQSSKTTTMYAGDWLFTERVPQKTRFGLCLQQKTLAIFQKGAGSLLSMTASL